MLGDLLTVNTYDNSERTFIALGDLLTVKAYDKSEHTFNVLGVLLNRQHLTPSAPSTCSASCLPSTPNPERTFNVLGDLLTVNTYDTQAHLHRARQPVDRRAAGERR